MNKTILTGRLTRDCDYRTGGKTDLAHFTLAVDRRRKEDGADFISCVAFGKTAEILNKYTHKGSKIGVEGRIQTGSYDDRGTGKKVYTTDIIIDSVELLDPKSDSTHAEAPRIAQNAANVRGRENVRPKEQKPVQSDLDGFMKGLVNIPDGIDEELPFE